MLRISLFDFLSLGGRLFEGGHLFEGSAYIIASILHTMVKLKNSVTYSYSQALVIVKIQ